MPIVTAQIGDVVGTRFAINLGSHNVLIMRRFAEAARLMPYGADRHRGFLEGPVTMRRVDLPDFIVGRVKTTDFPGRYGT